MSRSVKLDPAANSALTRTRSRARDTS
jgi:hypothetical protein